MHDKNNDLNQQLERYKSMSPANGINKNDKNNDFQLEDQYNDMVIQNAELDA
jgi:hypothetical protein